MYFSHLINLNINGEWPLSSRANYVLNSSGVIDDEGRFIRTTGTIEGSEMTLLNVYALSGSDWLFYRDVFDAMLDTQGPAICGAAFNFTVDPRLDSSNPTNHSQGKLTLYDRNGANRCLERAVLI